jgi:hypothetical protein
VTPDSKVAIVEVVAVVGKVGSVGEVRPVGDVRPAREDHHIGRVVQVGEV